ncbi:hypothetical protein [Neisseria iguanae]|nr:hypothetical protein [Neisseria iguanae]
MNAQIIQYRKDFQVCIPDYGFQKSKWRVVLFFNILLPNLGACLHFVCFAHFRAEKRVCGAILKEGSFTRCVGKTGRSGKVGHLVRISNKADGFLYRKDAT